MADRVEWLLVLILSAVSFSLSLWIVWRVLSRRLYDKAFHFFALGLALADIVTSSTGFSGYTYTHSHILCCTLTYMQIFGLMMRALLILLVCVVVLSIIKRGVILSNSEIITAFVCSLLVVIVCTAVAISFDVAILFCNGNHDGGIEFVHSHETALVVFVILYAGIVSSCMMISLYIALSLRCRVYGMRSRRMSRFTLALKFLVDRLLLYPIIFACSGIPGVLLLVVVLSTDRYPVALKTLVAVSIPLRGIAMSMVYIRWTMAFKLPEGIVDDSPLIQPSINTSDHLNSCSESSSRKSGITSGSRATDVKLSWHERSTDLGNRSSDLELT